MGRGRPTARWLALVGAVLFVACQTARSSTPSPAAVDGVLDLSGHDFDRDGITPLIGGWRFHWQRLLDPTALSAPGAPAGEVITQPGPWSAVRHDGAALPAAGYATYRLTVYLPPDCPPLALRVPPIRTAYRLFVDGTLAASGGRVSARAEEIYPAYAPRTVLLPRPGHGFDLTVQVANAHHREGGMLLPLSLGRHDQVLAEHHRSSGRDWVLLGAIFVMAIYHLGLFVVRRRERAPLYFAIYCLLICLRLPLSGQFLFYDAFPGADLRLVLPVEYAIFAIAGPVFCMFLAALYPREWHPRALRIIVVGGAILATVAVLAPLAVSTRIVLLMQALTGAGLIYGGYTLVRAVRAGREGAGLFASGFALQAAAALSDMLYYNGVIGVGPLVPYATFVFVFIQSFVLSRRFASAFAMAESYAATFRKFVPAQFLKRIAKEGLDSIRLGNVEADEITILFSDIRSFTTISEAMSPDEVFEMLNAYLSRMEPPIQQHGGFVDKYIGDAIMALFDLDTRAASARAAVDAALGMLAVLEEHNAELRAGGRAAIGTGIGLHSGEVMIGTVGSAERMDSTAIGDAVNLAARIEGMTKLYGVSLLISETTAAALPPDGPYAMRFVDRVRVKGKQKPVGVWQVVGRRGDARIAAIEPHLPTYDAALARYRMRDFDGAAAGFEAFLARVPDDVPAASHLDRCRQFTTSGVAEDWDEVVSLRSK